jgi:hypothetical protein
LYVTIFTIPAGGGRQRLSRTTADSTGALHASPTRAPRTRWPVIRVAAAKCPVPARAGGGSEPNPADRLGLLTPHVHRPMRASSEPVLCFCIQRSQGKTKIRSSTKGHIGKNVVP